MSLLALCSSCSYFHLHACRVLCSLCTKYFHKVTHLDLGLWWLQEALPNHFLPIFFHSEAPLCSKLLLLIVSKLKRLRRWWCGLSRWFQWLWMLHVDGDLIHIKLFQGDVLIRGRYQDF
uniref:Uncharacterized protein n=1 Tax=Triticum urartu TaxID=4572 RepID=A0A8R7QYI2_TRIUA